MAATTQLWHRATSRLVMSSGDRCGGQFLGTHGIHNRMFSTRGTHNYYEDYNYKPPEHYNDNYCYKPYNNSSNECSSRDKYFKDISEKYIPIKMKYDFEKLEYRILKMEYDFEKHYEKLHRAFQESVNEIRNERKKLVLDSNTEKLTNELNTVIRYTMRKLTNDLIQVCAKYVVKPKVDVYDHVLVCKENVAKPKAAVDDHDHMVVHEENVSESDSESNSKSEEEESEVEEEESEKSERESEEEKSEEEKEESEKEESQEEDDDKSDESKVAGDEQSMLHLQNHLLSHLLKRLSSDPSFKHLTRQKALKKE